MKKNILFIINNLNCGGAEKSLTTLLQILDYSKFNVDLLLLTDEGMFKDNIPEEVNLLKSPEEFTYFNMPLRKVLLKSLKHGRFDVLVSRLLYVFLIRMEKNQNVREQKLWKLISFCTKSIKKHYDVSIGYLQKTPTYFCVEKTNATKKIGYFLNDYNQLSQNKKIDNYFFSKIDLIVADSSECQKVLIDNFPHFESKFVVQKNIVSKKMVNKLSNEFIDEYWKGLKLVSVGKLMKQKGYDLAIEACKILVQKGHSFKWYILGNGNEENTLKKMITKYKLDDYFVFLGIKQNHYPYLKQADIFVHTARYEGHGIVVTEAKILNKPMIITDFNVARSHIDHNQTGLIADINPESIALNMEILINNDNNIREKFSIALSKKDFGTEGEIENFYKLLQCE